MTKGVLSFLFVATFALADENLRGVSDDTLTTNAQNLLDKEQNSLSANPQTTLAAKDNAFKRFFAEFGVGYTRMNFKATQTPLEKIYTKEGVATDIYEMWRIAARMQASVWAKKFAPKGEFML